MLTLGQRYAPEQLVPHRGRMLLLDHVEDYGDDWLRASLRVRADELLAGPQGVPAWAGIEYMAQAAAAYAGIEQVQQGSVPGIAFLLGSRRYESAVDWFEIGAQLTVDVRLVMRDDEGLGVFDCEVRDNARRLAWADIKAFRPQDAGTFLRGETA